MLLARCAVAFMGEYLYICFRFLPMRRKHSTTLGMPSLIFWYQRRKRLRPSLCFNTFWSFNGTYIERQMSPVQTIKTECAGLYIEGIHSLTLIFYCLLLIKCLSPIRVYWQSNIRIHMRFSSPHDNSILIDYKRSSL